MKKIFLTILSLFILSVLVLPGMAQAETLSIDEFKGTPSSGPAPLDVELYAAISTDYAYDIISYTFDCGNGQKSTLGDRTTENAVYQCNYSSAGNYTAKVDVALKDGFGTVLEASSKTASIAITGEVQTGACYDMCDGVSDCEKACDFGEKNLCKKRCEIYLPGDTACISACETLGTPSPIEDISGVENLIVSVARWISIIISIIAVIMLILGGFSYITSGGDEDKAGSAKKKIIYGLIGLAVAALAWGAEALVRSALQIGQ